MIERRGRVIGIEGRHVVLEDGFRCWLVVLVMLDRLRNRSLALRPPPVRRVATSTGPSPCASISTQSGAVDWSMRLKFPSPESPSPTDPPIRSRRAARPFECHTIRVWYEHMFCRFPLDRLRSLVCDLEEYVSSLDFSSFTAVECAEATELFSKTERIAAGGKSLSAARAASLGVHEQEGHRSAEQWLAALSGEGVGRARGAIESGALLGEDPELEKALRSGELSSTESALIADALRVNPDAGEKLLETARREPVRRLREQCEREKRAARTEEDEKERLRRLHESRFVRIGLKRDGAVTISGELSPTDGAVVKVALEAEARRVFEEASRKGSRESSDAYMADALTALCERGASVRTGTLKPPEHLVVLEVNAESLRRGELADGERCEIPGVGPVPLATAEELIGRARLRLVIREGRDVLSVTHLGRSIPAHVYSALVARDPSCVVPGCGSTYRLEIDHGICWSQDGPTELWNLHRLCSFHHRLKTYAGYSLEGGPGRWVWLSPAEREERDNPPPPSGPPEHDAISDDDLGDLLERDLPDDRCEEDALEAEAERAAFAASDDGSFSDDIRSAKPGGGGAGALARSLSPFLVVERVRNGDASRKRDPDSPAPSRLDVSGDGTADASRVRFARDLIRRFRAERSGSRRARRAVDLGSHTDSATPIQDDVLVVRHDGSRIRRLRPGSRGAGRWPGNDAHALERQGLPGRSEPLEPRAAACGGRVLLPHAELLGRSGEGTYRGDRLRGSGRGRDAGPEAANRIDVDHPSTDRHDQNASGSGAR